MWTPPSLRNPESIALQYTPERLRKMGTIPRSADTTQKSFSSSSELSDYSIYLQDEIFDIMPKTDYTYSRSGSYSRQRMNAAYESPNMSRRRIRGSLNQSSYIDDTNEMDESFSDSGEEDSNMVEHTERVYEYKTVLDKNGIELRSGKNLHNLRSILSSYDVRSRHSLASDTVNSSYMISTQGSQPLRNDRSANMISSQGSQSVRTNRSANRYANQESLSDRSVNMYSKDASRSLMSEKSVRTIRKTLTEEFDEAEKGSREAELSEKVSSRSGRSGRSRKSINHLYGLDSEEEFSETDSSLTKQSSYTHASDSASRSDSQSSLSTVTTTVVTTVIETVTTFTEPIVAPMWNHVGRPVWVTVGQPVVTAIAAVGRWLWNVLEYVMLRFILVDVWMLSRARAGRLCCCLCLPLLLLLPLLLAGSSLWASTSSFLPFGFFAAKNDTVINTIPSAQINMINLNEEVKRIVIQLQQSTGKQLGAAEVEAIVRNVLGEELSALKLQMTEDRNKDTTDEWKWKVEQAAKLDALQKQITLLKGNIESLEGKLSTDKEQFILHGDQLKGVLSANIGDLEEQLAGLRASFQNLELSHQSLALRMNNCCRNDSLVGVIEDQVNMILGQMMAGQTSGQPGQDAFTAWLHSNYVSKQDLEHTLAAMAADITEKILAKTKDGSHNTEVYIAGNGSTLSDVYVKNIVEELLLTYSADKTGMADFALESAGGSVISTRCSETYYRKTALVSIFGIPLWYASNSPRTVIQPEVHPGQCWAFRGTNGYLVIQLSTVIKPIAFSLEHIPKSLAPSGNIDSAPKDFSVFGLVDERDIEGVLLGNYTYNQNGKAIQYFPVQQVTKEGAFQLIELRILSNHGNVEFTCLYRFRVHGKPYRL